MQISSKFIALAGAAMTLAMTPAMAGAQDQATQEAGAQPAPGTTPPSTQPDSTRTGSDAPTGMDTATSETTTPPTNPESTPADAVTTDPADTTTATEAPPAAPQALTPADQEAAIKTWPRETQAYYQSLSEERQKMFWALTDTDKVRLSNLPDAQKETAWAQIESQIKGSQG